jgi:phosphoserine phosphatase
VTPPPTPSAEPPLCVDLDGTLIEGDTLHISLWHLARRSPWTLFALPFVLLRGRPAFKAFIARRYVPDPATLVWREEVLTFLREEKSRGRRIVLATAAHRRIGEAVANHLGFFDALVATDEADNLKGAQKTAHIRKCLSCNDFDYIGDNLVDVPIFAEARYCYLVAPSPALRDAAGRAGIIAREFHAVGGKPVAK